MRFVNWFKKYFVPHEGNEHKPHLLRWETTIAVLSFVLLSEIIFLAAIVILPRADFFASIISGALVQGTNDSRAETGFQALRVSNILTEAAKFKAEDMAEKGYFAHTSPEGKTPWNWLDKAGYKFSYAGENLAVNFSDSEDVIHAWLASPLHRANMLNKNFTEIGIATAQGIYKNQPATFIVQFFGAPALESAPEKVAAKKPTAIEQLPNSDFSLPAIPKSETTGSETFVMVAGANTAVSSGRVENMSLTGQLLSSPRRLFNFLYLIIATIVVLALIIKIFVKIERHPHLIVNGAVMLMIIAGVMVLNQYLFLWNARII